MKCIQRTLDRLYYIFFNYSNGGDYQYEARHSRHNSDDQGNHIDHPKPLSCAVCPCAYRRIQLIDVVCYSRAKMGDITVGTGVGILCLTVRTRTNQIDQRMLKRVIVL